MRQATMGAAGMVVPQLIRKGEVQVYSQAILEELNRPVGPFNLWLKRYRQENMQNILRGLERIQRAEAARVATFFGTLRAIRILPNGDRMDFGLVSTRVVTTAGVNFLVSAFANTVELEVMKYHAIGTGGTAEAVGDTALVTELGTEYNPNSTRATGSTTTGGASNIYRSVGTNTVDAAVTITEHGLMSQAATGGGTLWDRSLFAGISMNSGDSLQTTYDCTFTAGS